MATWVRNNSSSPSATDDVPVPFNTTVTLDNGTAPADFDPAGVTSVRIQYDLVITGISNDNWTDYQEANLGGTPLASVDGGNATRSSNGTYSKDLTDNSPDTGQSEATWEAAGLQVGTNGAWALWNKNKGPDGTTATVNNVTVTITYTPGATLHERTGTSDIAVSITTAVGAHTGVAQGTSDVAVSITTAVGKKTGKATGTSDLAVSTTATPHRIAKGSGSLSLAVTTTATGSVAGGAKEGTGASTLAVTTSATPQRIAKGTGGSSLAVTTSGTPHRIAKGTATSTLAVSTAGTPHRIAKGTGGSSVVLTSTASPHLIAKRTATSSLAITTAGTPHLIAKRTGSSTLAITSSATGAVAGTVKEATGSSSLTFTSFGHGSRHSGPRVGPFIKVQYIRNVNTGILVKIISEKHVSRRGWKASEGWEVITSILKVPVPHYLLSRMENQFRATWEANSGADAATLKTLIETDCTDAGYEFA